jgi:uncharacterized OB-fold protein
MTPALPAPEPSVNPETALFWQHAAEGRLMLTVCDKCREAIWYPRAFCPFCHGREVTWTEAKGTGTVYSFTTVRRGSGPYAGAAPYIVAYVELTEGPRLLTNLTECETDVQIGQPVEVVFHRTESGQALPRFRPSGR